MNDAETVPYLSSARQNNIVLVLSSYELMNLDDIVNAITRIQDDAAFLFSIHKNMQWIVYAVIVDGGAIPFFEKHVSRLPSHVAVVRRHPPSQFNKFLLIAVTQEYLSEYDFILMKDNAMLL